MLDRISNHSTKVLQLLVSLGVASSQDSTVRAAMMQLMAQLLTPHTLRPLMANKCSQKPCSLSSAGMQPAEAVGCGPANAATLCSSACSSSDAGEVRAPSCQTHSTMQTKSKINRCHSLKERKLFPILDLQPFEIGPPVDAFQKHRLGESRGGRLQYKRGLCNVITRKV